MKAEAIQQLEQFKSQLNGSQVETNSISEDKPKRAINYPKHIKPLHDRIMSAITGSKLRTSQAIATYCGEDDVKVVNMHLGRMLSSGKLVRYTNPVSSIARYYTPDEAKAKGYKPDAQPKKVSKKRSSSFVQPKSLEKADRMLANDDLLLGRKQKYIELLENRVTEWQAEGRRQAHEIEDLKAKLAEVRRTRDVTSEVTEVMEEVTKLRATVAYLESKLFGGK
jgi:hypothetical protein